MDEVVQLMLQARDFNSQDPDVQVVLGVLYNVTRHLDGAVEAFEAGTAARPQDYSLWNKLGATLANNNRSEDALEAYHTALEIKPRYTRGWLNLGISHANLMNSEAAVRCYLHALELNPEARHIWNYIRMALSSMERYDLVQMAAAQDVPGLRLAGFPPLGEGPDAARALAAEAGAPSTSSASAPPST